jgi:hypothetical protein
MKKKKENTDKVGPNRSPSYTMYARIRPELGQLFAQYMRDTRPAPTITAVLEVALEEFLATRGYTLPAENEQG